MLLNDTVEYSASMQLSVSWASLSYMSKKTLSNLINRPKKLLFFGLVAVVAAMVLTLQSTVYASQPYGNSAYGSCKYAEGCDLAQPPTIVNLPPSTANPQLGRAFSVNVHDNQKFTNESYLLRVIPNFSVQQIEKVEFLINGRVIGATTESRNNVFYLDWRLPKSGNYALSVNMYLTDGLKINRNFHISVYLQPNRTGHATDSVDKSTSNALKDLANKTPLGLAYTMPYLVLVLLVIFLLSTVYQTQKQLIYIKALLLLLEKDKQLIDEKTNFIMLASHFIRTPLTVLGGAIELFIDNEKDKQHLLLAQAAVINLHSKAEQILNDVQQNKDLQTIKGPDLTTEKHRLFRSFSLVWPIILSGLLIVTINYIYLYAQRTKLVVPSIFLQIVIFLLASNVLYIYAKRKSQLKIQSQKTKRQLDFERALDIARNQFIEKSVANLPSQIAEVKSNLAQAGNLSQDFGVKQAIKQLEDLLDQFTLVTQLERGKIVASVSNFYVNDIILEAISQFENESAKKRLKINKKLSSYETRQAKDMLGSVIKILLDNAIKFTPPEGKVVIKLDKRGRRAGELIISNSSPIEPARLSTLLKPFTHGQRVEVSSGGPGLSLYLARLIMGYIDGTLSLTSDGIKMTNAKLLFAINLDR